MARKGNASRQAMAELFMKCEHETQNISETKENSRREALKHELFQELDGDASDTKNAPVREPVKSSDLKVEGSRLEKLLRTDKVSVAESEKYQAAEKYKKNSNDKTTVAKSFDDAVGECRSELLKKEKHIPLEQNGSYESLSSENKKNFKDIYTEASSGVGKTKSDTQTELSASADKSFKTEEKNGKKVKSPRKKGKLFIASFLSLFFVAAVSTGIYFLIPKKAPEIPADILAGDVTSKGSEVTALNSTAADHITSDRFDVTFTFYESPDVVCNTPSAPVGEVMEKMDVICGENNRMDVSYEDIVSSDSAIDIKTLSYTEAYDTAPVDYETEYIDVRNIPKGTTKVKQDGKRGVKKFTYNCTLVNGVEESRELINEEITEKPTTRVLYRGVGGTVTSGGKTYSYSYYIDVRATCYNIVGTTASGLPTSTSVMAVDPRVIPLGTKCVVTGGSGDYGYRIAADTGGAIKGNTIDLWYPAGTFSGFGWRNTRVYILE